MTKYIVTVYQEIAYDYLVDTSSVSHAKELAEYETSSHLVKLIDDRDIAREVIDVRQRIDCPKCEGQGVIWFVDSLSLSGAMSDHEEICPVCHSSGYVDIDLDEDDCEEEE